MAICGAKTKGGKQCQRRVSKVGQRCPLHSQATPPATWRKILGVCEPVATITGTAQGVVWVYQTLWPHIEPLVQAGLFSPERFWWDNLAQPVQRGESPADIQSNLRAVLTQLRKDQKHIEDLLARHSGRDRERILNAYAKVRAAIRAKYPELTNAVSGVALPSVQPRVPRHRRSRL